MLMIKVEAIATNLVTFETSTVEMTLEVIPKQGLFDFFILQT